MQAYQVVRQTAEGGLEAPEHAITRLVKVESSAQHQQDSGYLVGVVQVYPLFQLFTKTGRRDTGESDTTRLTGLLELLCRERVNTLGVDHLARVKRFKHVIDRFATVSIAHDQQRIMSS